MSILYHNTNIFFWVRPYMFFNQIIKKCIFVFTVVLNNYSAGGATFASVSISRSRVGNLIALAGCNQNLKIVAGRIKVSGTIQFCPNFIGVCPNYMYNLLALQGYEKKFYIKFKVKTKKVFTQNQSLISRFLSQNGCDFQKKGHHFETAFEFPLFLPKN